WLSGNRGLEYAPVPGSGVRAIGPGVVVFAGPVAGALYVTILHPDGLRSSYSYLAAVQVTVGTRVLGGDIVGVAAAVFHLGVRQGDQYLDPASLFGQEISGGSVYLVPLDGGAGRAGGSGGGWPAHGGGPRALNGDAVVAGLGPSLVQVGLRLAAAAAEGKARAGAGS
ncbi:MAG: M23 family metallopeptidase, partial [Aquihabitans sp.]